MRAQMLALGLSRSSTSSQSTRRLRLLKELEASIMELQAEGFNDSNALASLKEQVRTSYATAPPEFVAEARRADPFKEGLPRLSLAEIAAEIADLAGTRVQKSVGGFEQGLQRIDWESLNPGRKRGPRELGNKIEINRREINKSEIEKSEIEEPAADPDQ